MWSLKRWTGTGGSRRKEGADQFPCAVCDPDNYKWVVTLSRPILGRDGRTEGVFFIDLNYKILSGLCEKNNLGANSYVFILDEAGNVIYHPKQQLLFRGLTTELTKGGACLQGYLFLVRKGKDGETLYYFQIRGNRLERGRSGGTS